MMIAGLLWLAAAGYSDHESRCTQVYRSDPTDWEGSQSTALIVRVCSAHELHQIQLWNDYANPWIPEIETWLDLQNNMVADQTNYDWNVYGYYGMNSEKEDDESSTFSSQIRSKGTPRQKETGRPGPEVCVQ